MQKGRAFVVGVLVVAIAGAGVVLRCGRGESTAAPSAAPTSVSNPADAEAAAGALEQLESNPAALLPAELEGELGDTVTQAVPAGTQVAADPSTWVPSTLGGGVIEAVLDYPDGTSQRIAVVMVPESDGWKVLQTIPLEEAR